MNLNAFREYLTLPVSWKVMMNCKRNNQKHIYRDVQPYWTHKLMENDSKSVPYRLVRLLATKDGEDHIAFFKLTYCRRVESVKRTQEYDGYYREINYPVYEIKLGQQIKRK